MAHSLIRRGAASKLVLLLPLLSTPLAAQAGLVPNGAKLYQDYVSGTPRPNATDGYSTTVSTVATFVY